jgi:energy-coupling factor transporter ATP-binding protein EcfA2
MADMLGQRFMEKHNITEEQLAKALERQRTHGGRLGENLVALGFVRPEDVDALFRKVPQPLKSVEETGLSLAFLRELILKHALHMVEFSIPDMSGRVKLPHSLIDAAIEELRKEKMAEAKSAGSLSKLSYRFALTDRGRQEAADLLERCRYAGPAPVPFQDYRAMVMAQTIKSILVREESVKAAFAHLIVNQETVTRLGPAVSSGKSIFLYGPPGNGKTTIAETIGEILPGNVFVPYAVVIEDEIITIFDPLTHRTADAAADEQDWDQRWVQVKRPVVMVGGELTLKHLDLDFNPVTKFYEAPFQMKANNGLLLIDDFGRQQVDPQKLLNRWIVPLERRTDFLTLHTGMKFEIPFDQLVIFSTNLEPKNLVDEAFLRRIRYKIKIDHPSREEYVGIFKIMCKLNKIEFDEAVLNYLLDHYYEQQGVAFNACHPRDLIDSIVDQAHYSGQPRQLTRETISAAWESYFVEL